MRLLKWKENHHPILTADLNEDDLPPYAILSHTWAAEHEEVTFEDLQQDEDTYRNKPGFKKIRLCGDRARKDGITHFWVDTCCINKANYSELSEAITSMYRWYHKAQKCYVYLSDLSSTRSDNSDEITYEWKADFAKCRWFTRGWTLQELLAPKVVEFFSHEGDLLGTKQNLAEHIHEATSIPLAALYDTPPNQFSIAERWRWAENRQTKRVEDRAYSLLGIFDVFMPLIYGKGKNAFHRLEDVIRQRSETIISAKSSADHRRERLDIDLNKFDKLHKSLLFHRMDFRTNNIKKPLLSTCEWLFRHPSFQSWYNSIHSTEHNNFLWIKGKPGCGKSTLMKAALEWAQRRTSYNRAEQTIVPYFFNARASASLEKSSLGLYRTVVHHLLLSGDSLRPLFARKFALKCPGSSGENWTVEELQDFLCDCVESGHSFELCLFVDALDEAKYETDIRDMIAFLTQLSDRASAVSNSCQLRVCLSSRHYPHIATGRGLSLVVEEQPEHSQDIEIFVEKRLTCADGCEKVGLCAQILSKSAHVFLWVVLVVALLNKLDDDGELMSDMRSRLDTIPSDLNELFRDILIRDGRGIEKSVLLFQWMLFSMRALNSAELYLGMEYGQMTTEQQQSVQSPISVPSSDRLSRHILTYSRGLVEFVRLESTQSCVVQFIHETVREFLLKKDGLSSIDPALNANLIGTSHDMLRRACDRYASANTIPPKYQHYYHTGHGHDFYFEVLPNLHSKLPLFEYTGSYLFMHAEQAQTNGISQQAFLRTQVDEHGLWIASQRLWWNVLERHKSRKIKPEMLLLRFLVDKQYLSLVSTLIAAPDVKGEYSTVLQSLSQRGHLKLAQQLIERGVHVGAPEAKNGSALWSASLNGDVNMVQLLLGKGIAVHARGGQVDTKGQSETALEAASREGHIRIVQLLLGKGAHLYIDGEQPYARALAQALSKDHTHIVRELLNRGADADVTRRTFGIALNTATIENHCEVVQFLLDKGLRNNHDTKRSFYISILRMACDEGWLQTVALLVSHTVFKTYKDGDVRQLYRWPEQELYHRGTRINTEEHTLQTTFERALREGDAEIVEMLLTNWLNIDAQAGGKLSDCGALYHASRQGWVRIVQMLLDTGMNVNRQYEGEKYNTALQAACGECHVLIVQMLLEKGTDVNDKGRHYGAALQIACANESEQIVQMLLDNGADTDVPNSDRGTALYLASQRGCIQILQLLLENGANPNTEGPDRATALQAAVAGNHKLAVQMLLAKGADPNISNSPRGPALSTATHRGYVSIVQMLLDGGADPNTKGTFAPYTVLAAAAMGGFESIVRLLLSKGADPNVRNQPRESASRAMTRKRECCVVHMSGKEADSDSLDRRCGKTALYMASRRGYTRIVQILLDSGADPNIISEHGQTALDVAWQYNYVYVVQILLESGADPDLTPWGRETALHHAKARNRTELVRLRLSKGAK